MRIEKTIEEHGSITAGDLGRMVEEYAGRFLRKDFKFNVNYKTRNENRRTD